MYGTRLVSLRKKKNLTQAQLTKLLGFNRSTYARYESEKSEPDFDTLDKLADFHEVTVDYILGRSNYPTLDQNSSDFADKHGIFESKHEERDFSMDYENWTEEEKEEMREFVRFKMEQRKKKQQKSDK